MATGLYRVRLLHQKQLWPITRRGSSKCDPAPNSVGCVYLQRWKDPSVPVTSVLMLQMLDNLYSFSSDLSGNTLLRNT